MFQYLLSIVTTKLFHHDFNYFVHCCWYLVIYLSCFLNSLFCFNLFTEWLDRSHQVWRRSFHPEKCCVVLCLCGLCLFDGCSEELPLFGAEFSISCVLFVSQGFLKEILAVIHLHKITFRCKWSEHLLLHQTTISLHFMFDYPNYAKTILFIDYLSQTWNCKHFLLVDVVMYINFSFP